VNREIINRTLNTPSILKSISVITPFLAVAVGLYIIGNGWITFGLYHGGLLLFILLAGQRRIFKEIFTGWNWTAGVIAIIFSSLVGLLLWLLWPFISIEPDALATQLGALGFGGVGRILFIFVFVTVNPVMEEVYWRIFLKGKGQDKEILPWVVEIMFASYHLPVLAFFIKPAWLVFAFIVLYIGGCVWRWLSHRFGGVAIPLISHIAADASIIIAVQIIGW
jgi:hypothetical protein